MEPVTQSFPQPRILPINVAEAIIEPFYDAGLCRLDLWCIGPEGVKVKSMLSGLEFALAHAGRGALALVMSRRYDLDISGCDRLLVSANPPQNATLKIEAETERGIRSVECDRLPDRRREYGVALGGAQRLLGLRIDVRAGQDGPQSGWINWIGLQNAHLLERHLASRAPFGTEWAPHLRPETDPVPCNPLHGLFLTADELDALREAHRRALAETGTSPWLTLRQSFAGYVPEDRIGDAAGISERFARDRDLHARPSALALSLTALVLDDPTLLRLAARRALSLALCPWSESFFNQTPGGDFNHRAFEEAFTAESVAILADLAGEWLTPHGRNLLLRRLANDGVGFINFNAWRYDYIHTCNQLAAFSPGRLAAYAVLSRTMPRVAPYAELALSELTASVEATVLEDGGYIEGPAYCLYALNSALRAYWYAARMTNRDISGLLPDVLRKTATFADSIASTADRPVVEFADCGGVAAGNADILALLASLLPRSGWVTIYRSLVPPGTFMPLLGDPAAQRTFGPQPIAAQLDGNIPAEAPEPPALVRLPRMGLMASHRRHEGEWVKLFLMGNVANAGHNHEDRGSFVLEFAGDAFACDPGICAYGHPLVSQYRFAQRHNMLVPLAASERRPAPTWPCTVATRPEGRGDATAFHAAVDLTATWPSHFAQWIRTWDSPYPGEIVIADDYELKTGEAVAFLWQTRLPVHIEGGRAIIEGGRGRVILHAPEDTTPRLDDLSLAEPDACLHCISICRHAARGRLAVRAELQRK